MAAWQSSTPSSKDRKYADAELFAAYLASDAGAHGCLADDWSTLACALPVFWLLSLSRSCLLSRVQRRVASSPTYLKRAEGGMLWVR